MITEVSMNNKKIFVPKEFIIPMAVFAVVFILGIVNIGDIITGLSMACLFGSLAALLAYIITAVRKHKSGLCLFTFIILLILFLVLTPFTAGYSAIGQSAEICGSILIL